MDTHEKFRKMIELLINEEQDKMPAIFHEIMVEKSRVIYESLIDEEDLPEARRFHDENRMPGGDQQDDFVNDIESDEEGLSLEDAADELDGEMGLDGGDEFGGDDEFGGGDEFGGDEFGGEPAEEEEIEDRVVDLENSMEELEAKFSELMGDEEGMGDEFGGMGDELGGDEVANDFGDEMNGDEYAEESFNRLGESDDEEVNEADEEEVNEADDEEVKEADEDVLDEENLDEETIDNIVREYVDNVATPTNSEEGGGNHKSPTLGKNTIVSANGATVKNLAQGDDADAGRANPPVKVDDAGNINKPGAKSSTHQRPGTKPDLKNHDQNKKSVLDKIQK